MIKAKPVDPAASVTDPSEFLERLGSMLYADSDYTWASDTIEGIHETVMKTNRVTAGQLRAIDNIEEGAERHSRGRW